MEGFPIDFCFEKVNQLASFELTTTDVRNLNLCRRFVYDLTKYAVASGEKQVNLPMADFSSPAVRYHLAKELCQRFPGRVFYYQSSGRLPDCVYKMITDAEHPPVSTSYKVMLV
jgi:hypothetical protein